MCYPVTGNIDKIPPGFQSVSGLLVFPFYNYCRTTLTEKQKPALIGSGFRLGTLYAYGTRVTKNDIPDSTASNFYKPVKLF
jgi:hypothetical protein